MAEFIAHKTPAAFLRIRAQISAIFRRKLKAAQDGCCYLCAQPMLRGTVDHVIPISRGGSNHGNILLAHEKCNTTKADRMPTSDELATLARVNALVMAR